MHTSQTGKDELGKPRGISPIMITPESTISFSYYHHLTYAWFILLLSWFFLLSTTDISWHADKIPSWLSIGLAQNDLRVPRESRVSAGERSWRHSKDDKDHRPVSSTLFHYPPKYSQLFVKRLVGLWGIVEFLVGTRTRTGIIDNMINMIFRFFTMFSALLSVGIAFLQQPLLTPLTTICHRSPFNRTCPHLKLSKMLMDSTP